MRLRFLLLFAMCAAALVPAPETRAASREWQLKAAFLYRLATFVDWPEDSFSVETGFCVGVLGEDPFGSALDDAFAGRSLNGLPVNVQRGASPAALRGCQVVFVSATETQNLGGVLGAFARQSVLTVSDLPGFAGRGGIIGLHKDGARLRFEINAAAARRSGLTLSSKLLRLATTVHEG